MQPWKGWSTPSRRTDSSTLTWDEWRAYQRRCLGSEDRQYGLRRAVLPFSELELARLCFVRWLYHKGSL